VDSRRSLQGMQEKAMGYAVVAVGERNGGRLDGWMDEERSRGASGLWI